MSCKDKTRPTTGLGALSADGGGITEGGRRELETLAKELIGALDGGKIDKVVCEHAMLRIVRMAVMATAPKTLEVGPLYGPFNREKETLRIGEDEMEGMAGALIPSCCPI
jgi:hypothetical protein